jgi:hypothetical protein
MARKEQLTELQKLLQKLKESESERKEVEDLIGMIERGFGRKNPWDNLSEKEKKDYVSLLLKI